MVDDIGVLEAMIGQPAEIDLMCAVAAAGKTDVGLARLAGPIDDTADDRNRQRRRYMGEALLEPFDRLDHFELLSRAGRARNHRDPAPAQVQ